METIEIPNPQTISGCTPEYMDEPPNVCITFCSTTEDWFSKSFSTLHYRA